MSFIFGLIEIVRCARCGVFYQRNSVVPPSVPLLKKPLFAQFFVIQTSWNWVSVALLFKFYGIVVALFLIFHTADIFGPGIGALRPSVASFVLNLSNGHRIDISFQVLVFNIPRPSLSNQSDYYPLSL